MDNTPLPDGLEAMAMRAEREEGSRELDNAIRAVTHGDAGHCGDEGWLCSACSVPAHELTQEPGCGAPMGLSDERTSYPSDWRDDERLPHYSTSLDAAMSLVPTDGKGWGYRLQHHDDLVRKEWAEVWTHEDAEPGDGFFKASGHSIALALCAAALRARAQIGGAS